MSEPGRWIRVLQAACAAAGLLGSGCGGEDPDSNESTNGTDATVGGGSTSTGTSSTTATSSTTGNPSSTTASSSSSSSTTGAGGVGGLNTSGGAGGASTESTSTSTSGAGAGIDCLTADDGGIVGTPASCDFVDDSYDCCTRCVTQRCCEEFGACFASAPYNVCGGAADSYGEFAAIQECMIYIPDGGAVPSDLESCVGEAVEQVSGPFCDLGAISGPTNDLAACIRGDQDGLGGCFEECFTPFDESECLF